MSIFLLISGCLLFVGALVLLFFREPLSPLVSFLGLMCFYFSALLPLSTNMLITWLAITVVVTGVSFGQPHAVMSQRRGMGYITAGAITGLAIGLLGSTISSRLQAIYAILLVAIAVGIFFAYLLFTRTPDGAAVNLRSGRFFSYLLAKGFPAAITVMQAGVVIMLALVPLLSVY